MKSGFVTRRQQGQILVRSICKKTADLERDFQTEVRRGDQDGFESSPGVAVIRDDIWSRLLTAAGVSLKKAGWLGCWL